MLAAFASAPLSAQDAPPSLPSDPRDQIVAYDPNQIVQLQGAPGYQLTVEFAPDELIENVAVGDASAWQVTPNRRGDHLFVKPIQYGVSTNMTVITTVRVYLFELVSGGAAAFRVRFTYPAEAVAAEEAQASGVEGRYRLSGTRSLRPSRISDDGIHTYVEWPEDRDIPAVYAIDARGRESLVNGAMRDGIFVIDSISRQLVFRIDRHTARATRVREQASD